MWNRQLWMSLALLLSALAAGRAHAELTIQITGGTEGALPIAVVPFQWNNGGAAPEDLAQIISSDLARSGRFAPTAREKLSSRPHDAQEVDYRTWKALGVDDLVVGKLLPAPAGGYQVQFQLLDVYRGAQLAGYSIPATRQNLRRRAHQISDIVYKTLLGERGAFDTHIAYVTARGGPGPDREYRLAIADSDGYNEQVILDSKQPIMSPAWAPDGRRLAYVSFSRGRPEIYIQDVVTQQTQRVSDHPGLNGAPSWSPDGGRLALTLSKDGNPEIYVLDLASRQLTRITNDFAIDTEADWTPDGKALVFTSDRGGSPQLYRVPVDANGATGRPQRLTFDGSYNAAAAVSPDGKHIAMVHRDAQGFHIGVLELATGHFQTLTDTTLDESPSFAPNGSMIIYATEAGPSGVLAAVSVDGRAHQRLSLRQGDVREPAWSPFRPQ